VKLLFDENLSPRLVQLLASEFPESSHVELIGARGCADAWLLDYVKVDDLVTVSKDNDFR
jgi:predicted nuclease of predicted toxin-antitoxin system